MKAENIVEKEYIKKLSNGTSIKVKICVEVNDFNHEDYTSLFNSFANCSRDFYLRELNSVVNAN